VNAIVHVPELTVIPFILVKVSCKKCGKRSPPFRLSSNWNTTCPKCKSDNITFTTDVMYQVVYQDGEPENDTETEFSYADFENHEEFAKFIMFLNQEREKAGNPLIEPFPMRY